jgi:hypothetical protein
VNGLRFWYEHLQNNSNGGIMNKGQFYPVTVCVPFLYTGLLLDCRESTITDRTAHRSVTCS